ncbi:MAG: hypothetical protein HWD61_03480 [Parachlamydiaceae bacterium]|nr:MAG: hypothetical protein HWD61_03480 [Parachlamydiaceae bacterium]
MLHKLVIRNILLLSLFTSIHLYSNLPIEKIADRGGFDRSNQIYSGNRFDEGNLGRSNQIYSGNAFDANRFNNNFYRNVENEDAGYYNYSAPYAPAYGYGYFGSAPEEPNSQEFPASTEANALYWGEVQQMEQQ